MNHQRADETFHKHAVAGAAEGFTAIGAAPQPFADGAHVNPMRSRHGWFLWGSLRPELIRSFRFGGQWLRGPDRPAPAARAFAPYHSDPKACWRESSGPFRWSR